jgi:hypothetical protein
MAPPTPGSLALLGGTLLIAFRAGRGRARAAMSRRFESTALAPAPPTTLAAIRALIT